MGLVRLNEFIFILLSITNTQSIIRQDYFYVFSDILLKSIFNLIKKKKKIGKSLFSMEIQQYTQNIPYSIG